MRYRLILTTLATLLMAGPSLATDFSGSYTTTNVYGQPILLELRQDAEGDVEGSLKASGLEFVVDAETEGGRLEGFVSQTGAEGESYLQAEFRDNRLQVIVVDLYDGVPNPATQQSFVFDRTGVAQSTSQSGLTQALGGQSAASGPSIATGQGGSLTEGGFNAYMEALEFCLEQIGNPTRIDRATRAQFRQTMIAAYPGLPAEVQQNLANSEAIWQQYRQSWPVLSLEQKKEFAYGVLALAYGEQAAAEALGIPQGGSGESGSSKKYNSYYSSGGAGGYGSYASDGECSYFSSGGMSISTCD